MFKPLLRTIPTLTGNFTLACKLDKYKKNSVLNFECGVTEAVMMPLQNNLANKHTNVSLLYDSYEYDVQLYYKSFSSLFYEDNYYFDKSNVYELDRSSNKTYDYRNKDYEFGCKRNIMNSGYQYMFFAPFYITNTKSLPDEFIIHIEFETDDKLVDNTKKYNNNIYKNIHVKIFDDSDTDKVSNYLSVYLKRYAEKIDERCIFCQPESNQATYFGIDVQQGGFKMCTDNVISIIYNKQLSLNDYDKIINNGFSRNKIVMKQIVPMSFMFNISDILTRNEYNTYINKKVKISGWYERNGMKYDFYDFDTDYRELKLNDVNILNPTDENIKNNKNLQYSLHETRDNNLKYDNTLSITHNRWCLLPTLNREQQYITNSSSVFLDSHNNYYDVPIQYQTNSSYLYYDDVVDDIDISRSKNEIELNNIKDIVTQTHFDKDNVINETNWYDVYNNKCMIGGLLYDINKNTYTTVSDSKGNVLSKYIHIDKFNIFAYMNIINIDNEHNLYCKYSFDDDNPHHFNGTAYNKYRPGMFTSNIVANSLYYEKHHNVNTLFSYSPNEPISYNDISYCISYNLSNYGYFSVSDDIYIDYSRHYYLSNLYKKENIGSTNIPTNAYAGFEIYDVDVPSFMSAVSYYSYWYEPDFYGPKLVDICYVTVNQSNNAIAISDKSTANIINSRNSRLAFYNYFTDCHIGVPANTDEYPLASYNYIKDNFEPYITSYYHYIPGYEGSAFISHGHMERNDKVNVNSYVYCDNWILNEYVEYINRFVPESHKITSADIGRPFKAYMGFINYDHLTKYRKRMYNNNGNNVDDHIYILDIRAQIERNGYYIKNFNVINTMNKLDDLSDKKYIRQMIDEHKLYHYDSVVKITKKLYDKILNIYNYNKDLRYDKTMSLILYTDNTDIIDNFKFNEKTGIYRGTDNSIVVNNLLIPITREILWSNKSLNETYKILSSNNIRTNQDKTYITHKIYDLESCNKINLNNKNDVRGFRLLLDEDPDVKLYKRNNTKTIDTDNTMHIVNKDGLNYAYYYITLNLYNNIYSFNINTDNNIDSFDISPYTLTDMLPYIKANLLDYIINTLASDVIVNKNDINIIVDKEFEESINTVVQKDVTSKLGMSRYFNDITPLLKNTSRVTSYNLLSTLPGNDKYKEIKYAYIVCASPDCSIEYMGDDTENSTYSFTGIPYIDYKGTINHIKEYEQKFYNDNEFYLLSPKFEITDKSLYTIEQVREIEKNDYVFNNIFIPHMNKFLGNRKLEKDEYLFLFNRYRIDYTSYPARLNLLETHKLYSLKFTFTLL